MKRRKTSTTTSTARPIVPVGDETHLGTFHRGNVIAFDVYEVPSETEGTTEYRVYGDDGPGPRLICWFTSAPETPPIWRGAWDGDAWCGWIEEQARKCIANPEARSGP